MKKKGIALGIVIGIVTVVFIGFFGILKMMRGVSSQTVYSDAHLRALAIAESGANYLIARLMSAPWEERWFKNGPDMHGSPIPFNNGSFIYVIQDTVGKPKSADIWVRAQYGKTARLVFCRVKYQDLLFRGLTNPTIDFTKTLEEENAGKLNAKEIDKFTQTINKLITQRENARGEFGKTNDEVKGEIDPIIILRKLTADVAADEILQRSKLPNGEFAQVSKPPPEPKSANGKSTVMTVDHEKTDKWIHKQGFEPEFAAYLKQKAKDEYKKVEKAVQEGKYLEAEQILNNFLRYMYALGTKINDETIQEKMRYQSALSQLETQAQAESWPIETLENKKEELARVYRENLQKIFNQAYKK